MSILYSITTDKGGSKADAYISRWNLQGLLWEKNAILRDKLLLSPSDRSDKFFKMQRHRGESRDASRENWIARDFRDMPDEMLLLTSRGIIEQWGENNFNCQVNVRHVNLYD